MKEVQLRLQIVFSLVRWVAVGKVAAACRGACGTRDGALPGVGAGGGVWGGGHLFLVQEATFDDSFRRRGGFRRRWVPKTIRHTP